MSEPRAATISAAATDTDLELQHQLDALVRGERSEDEFVDEISAILQGAPNSSWNIVALIHQRYRQEEISADAFRSIVSKIVGRELDTTRYSTSVGPTSIGPKTPVAEQPPVSIDGRDQTSTIEVRRVVRDRYVIDQRLGSGETGTVFRALDRYRADLPEAKQYVAIKILHEEIDDRRELLAHMRREFYCTQMLSHRNIVKMYELDRDGDLDFCTMELLEGELLSSVIERLHSQPMSRPYAWAIIRQLGSALAHAHARDVVHADLKPHNIVITDSGEVRILGFCASITAAEQTPELALRRKNAVSVATIAYASCELLAGRSADTRDDIYSLACISYELLEGTHPFQNRPSTVARDLAIVPTRPPGLTRRQWKALATGLSWHRAGRSIPVHEWLNKLDADRVAARQLPRARELRPAPANPRPTPSWRAALFAVLLIAATVGVPVIRVAPVGKVRGDEVVQAVAANQQLERGAVSGIDNTGPDGKAPADSVSSKAQPPPANTHSQVANNARRDADHSKPPSAPQRPIVVSPSIRPGEKFAEIRVHRTPSSRSNGAFVWWTEAASAKPGIDYVYQGKVTQSFPKGKSSTSFFIKLLPNSSRARPEVFYVAIADAGGGASTGQIARAAIWLPTTHGHS